MKKRNFYFDRLAFHEQTGQLEFVYRVDDEFEFIKKLCSLVRRLR